MKEWISLSKWYAWRLTFVGRLWHLSLVIMILLWHLSLAVTFVEAKLRHSSLAVTFVEAKLWHLSLAVTFVEAKLWHLSLAGTFVEAMLWHLSLAVTFVEGCCDICRGLWHLVGLWHLSAQQTCDQIQTGTTMLPSHGRDHDPVTRSILSTLHNCLPGGRGLWHTRQLEPAEIN